MTSQLDYSTQAIIPLSFVLYFKELNPPLIVPKNHDIRVRAIADGASTDVGAGFNGHLAEITTLYD